MVIDHENIAGVGRHHRFQENIDAAEMFCRERATSEPLTDNDRTIPNGAIRIGICKRHAAPKTKGVESSENFSAIAALFNAPTP